MGKTERGAGKMELCRVLQKEYILRCALEIRGGVLFHLLSHIEVTPLNVMNVVNYVGFINVL